MATGETALGRWKSQHPGNWPGPRRELQFSTPLAFPILQQEAAAVSEGRGSTGLLVLRGGLVGLLAWAAALYAVASFG